MTVTVTSAVVMRRKERKSSTNKALLFPVGVPDMGPAAGTKRQPSQEQSNYITVACPYCHYTANVPSNYKGIAVTCPKCGSYFKI